MPPSQTGAQSGGEVCSGLLGPAQQGWHVKLLEMELVYLALNHFLPIILGRRVMGKSDSPAVRYINCKDGSRSPVLYLNAFSERLFMNSFIFWANVNWMYCILPDERYCERIHSGICERCSLKVLLRSRECPIPIEPSRWKLAKTHRKQALICSRKSPNLATPGTTESHRCMHHQHDGAWRQKQMKAAALR